MASSVNLRLVLKHLLIWLFLISIMMLLTKTSLMRPFNFWLLSERGLISVWLLRFSTWQILNSWLLKMDWYLGSATSRTEWNAVTSLLESHATNLWFWLLESRTKCSSCETPLIITEKKIVHWSQVLFAWSWKCENKLFSYESYYK